MKSKILILLFISISGCLSISAQLSLIPTPKKVTYKTSTFKIEKDTKLASNQLDTFYTNQLINCIKKELGIEITLAKKTKYNFIEFIKAPSAKDLKEILSANKLSTDFKIDSESYLIDIRPESIKVFALTDAGIFYGIQTLKQIIQTNRKEKEIPCLTIYDYPDIPVRAWQDDISRGPIPTMATLKDQIVKMSSFKLNYFSLYIEQVFKLDKHPEIAPEDGITKAQIKELSVFAKKYHVNLIGSYQSFGHMEKTLSNPKYQHLAENNHIISPALPESYEFLKDVYQEIVPSFSGEYFNINCDETDGLGEGKSKNMVDSMGIAGVYLYHIKKLDALLQPYGKKILMWGDIVGNHPEIIDKLPKGITVIAWGYHAADNFEYAITPISDSGLDFWVAPGINCWSNIFPNFYTTKINVYNFIRDAKKHGVKGVLNTSWDDDGLNFFQNNWHGFIWGAENSWNTPISATSVDDSKNALEKTYSRYNQAFDAIFYGLKEDSLTSDIVAFSALHQSTEKDLLSNSRFFEPVFPIHLGYVSQGKKQENRMLLNRLDSLIDRVELVIPKVRDNQFSLEYLKFAMQEVHFTLLKNIFRIELYNYIQNSEATNASEIKSSLNALLVNARLLKTTYSSLWQKENRNYWLENNLQKFDNLIESLSNLATHCIITPSVEVSEKGREITMKSLFGDLQVYYTTDTSALSSISSKYTAPLYFNEDVSIRASAFPGNNSLNISTSDLIFHKGIGKLYKLNSTYSTYHPGYDGGGVNGLLDGIQGSAIDLRSGKWQGYSGQNIDIEIDLDKIQPINHFSMGFYQNTFDWVIFPKKIDIYSKNNITDDYQLIKTITNTIPPEAKGAIKHNYTAEFQNLETRYLKIIAHNYGKLPEWHTAGSQYDSMIFADEIIIK